MVRRLLLGSLFALALSAPLSAAERLELAPPEWNLGMILQGVVVHQELVAVNRDTVPLTVTLVPTCDCNSVTPASQRIEPGRRAVFYLSYDSSYDQGIVTKSFLVRTDLPGSQPSYYFVRGTVREQAAVPGQGAAVPAANGWQRQDAGPASVAQSAASGDAVSVSYYYTPGCRTCEQFLALEIPGLQTQLGRRIDVVRRDLLSAGTYAELAALASARGQTVTAVPVLVAGDVLLQGDAVIREKLPAVLASMAVRAGASARAPAHGGVRPPVLDRLTVLPVAAAGLMDGINPCAFTTLIFLLASLALAGRGRNEVLVIGALFSAAVFLTYFLVGLGLFSALRAASAVSIVSVLLRWILVAVLAVFAGLSVYDYFLIRAGRPAEILLQLPSSFKKRIHATIRARVRTAALAGSSVVLGFLVSLFEFACTGQVYLPMLGYLARMRRQPDALALLALYNLCFILPLLVVFGASWLGVTSGRITAMFQTHMGKVKLGLAVVFAGLAVLTLVG